MSVRGLVGLALLALHAPALAEWVVDGTFTAQGLLGGHTMTESECVPHGNSLWLVVDGEGECVRYFHAGLEPETGNALVHLWLHGDRLRPKWGTRLGKGKPTGNEVVDYADSDPRLLQAEVDGYFAGFGVPFIRLSRPGTYGSSGDHRERRRPREVAIVRAAVEALKQRHRIAKLALSGHGGGAHLAATLLPGRDDLSCVVLASGHLAVRHRMGLEGWSTDLTGYRDSVDPIELIDAVPNIPTRPILLVGDPRDQRVWFESQQTYYEALVRGGHRVFMLAARAPGPDYHDLEYLGISLVRWCLEGRSVSQMAEATKFITEVVEPGTKKYASERDHPSDIDRGY